MFYKKKKIKNDEVVLLDGESIKIGRDAIAHTKAKASFTDILRMLRDVAKKDIMPLPTELI